MKPIPGRTNSEGIFTAKNPYADCPDTYENIDQFEYRKSNFNEFLVAHPPLPVYDEHNNLVKDADVEVTGPVILVNAMTRNGYNVWTRVWPLDGITCTKKEMIEDATKNDVEYMECYLTVQPTEKAKDMIFDKSFDEQIKEGGLIVFNIDGEQYLVDANIEFAPGYQGMCVYTNGDGSGNLKSWISPYILGSSGAKYYLLAASKSPLFEDLPTIEEWRNEHELQAKPFEAVDAVGKEVKSAEETIIEIAQQVVELEYPFDKKSQSLEARSYVLDKRSAFKKGFKKGAQWIKDNAQFATDAGGDVNDIEEKLTEKTSSLRGCTKNEREYFIGGGEYVLSLLRESPSTHSSSEMVEPINIIPQYTNEEYLDLHGSKENAYLKARISSQEYFKLSEDKRNLYMRFCGHHEVYYTLKP